MKVNQFHVLVSLHLGEPQRHYGEPQRHYGEPQRHYGEPQRHYGEGRSYCPHQELNPGHPITSFTEKT